MGFFKQMKDMKAMVTAAPGLVQQGQELAAEAQRFSMAASTQAQMAQAQAYAATAGQPLSEASLAPIQGVDMGTYAWVAKQVAKNGYDQSLAAGFAAQRSIGAADWDVAANGWSTRMQAEPALGREFRRHFDAA